MFRSGWANNCGLELFTHSWVLCSLIVSESGLLLVGDVFTVDNSIGAVWISLDT